MSPRLLDLYSGGGGAAMGYHRAGFEVVGVDIMRQPHYPFEFVQQDALEFLVQNAGEFDVVHASPPCQAYTRKSANWGRKRTHWIDHPDLVDPTRALLQLIGLPYVIENVPGAPLYEQLWLCGTMFGLRIQKHRLFEANWTMPGQPGPCDHSNSYNPWQGKDRDGKPRGVKKLSEAMGIDWLPIGGGASRKAGYTGDLSNAIPPPYTEWIGRHLMEIL